jgi:hypothetical protein
MVGHPVTRSYLGAVVVVGLGTVPDVPAPDVVVVVLGGAVVVEVDGVLVVGDSRVVVWVVPVGDVVLVVVVVVGGLALPLLPPKKVCPEPDWPRTTAERGRCATSSMMVSETMAMTRTATMAPTTGTRMLRQFGRG